MNHFKTIMLTAVALLALAACSTDDLRDDVDNLKSRVESLEAQVNLLNDNMTAIRRLLGGGQTITEVTNTNGTYTLKLSDGETLTLTQGSKGEVKYPEITVNAAGQWVVNGQILMQNGTPVQAVGLPGQNGIAPKFRITEEGNYWQISYDEGTSWTDVLGEDGQRVSAVGDGTGGGTGADSFFEEVYVDPVENLFVVRLKGESTPIYIPIIKDLLCEIMEPTAGMKNGFWEIGYGETVTTTVKVKGENIIVTAPAGWVATLTEADPATNEATLTIIAPATAAPGTRATADNTSDVTIQVNKGADWAVDKIQVKAVEVIESYYALYQEGRDIACNGVVINKAQYGEATFIDENAANKSITTGGVYFLQPGVEVTTTASVLDHLILIGDSPTEKATCTLTGNFINIAGDGTKGVFIMNVILNAGGLASYVCRINGSVSFVVLNNDDIIIGNGRNLIQCQDAGVEVKDNITISNSRIKFDSTADWAASRILNFTQGLTCREVTIDNNVIYPSSMTYTINGTLVYASPQTISSDVTISRNTILNFIPASQSLVRGKITGSVTFSNLLFLFDSATARNGTLLNIEEGAFQALTFTDLIRYNRGSLINLNPFGGSTPTGHSNTAVSLAGTDPFDGGTFDLANGIFVPNAQYAAYGATN